MQVDRAGLLENCPGFRAKYGYNDPAIRLISKI